MPSKKKKYNARFPAGRIKKIMQTDEEVGKVAQAVPVIISRTLELFVSSLLTKAMEITSAKNAKTLSPSHMKQCILSDPRFDFLKDLVSNVQDLTNGDDEAPVPSLLSSGNRSTRERRKSSCSGVKEEPPEEKESLESMQKTPVKEELLDVEKTPSPISREVSVIQKTPVKEEFDIMKTPGVANCSNLHLNPNFYTETSHDPRLSIHRPPVVVGYPGPEVLGYQPPVLTPFSYPPPVQSYPIPHPELSPSPVLVMDEDYDT